ncbi:MAG: hypothetical protein QXO12_01350 [Candidatus Pacearchaeota archaeon]
MKEKSLRLIGFDSIGEEEIDIAKKLVSHYLNRINNIIDYDELKVNLKLHERGNLFIHEIRAELFTGSKVLVATSESKNLFSALADCFEALLVEIDKNFKKKKRS